VRYFLDIAYKGSSYHGWQVQPNANTIQAEVNQALSTLLRQKTECVGSGRTDAGVHARQQIAHFDGDLTLSEKDFAHRLNTLLPKDISISKVSQVKKEAHARFDATSRSYEYHIHQHKNPFLADFSYAFSRSLNSEWILSGIDQLKNWKNFQAFSKVHTEVNHFECDIYHMAWEYSNGRHLFSVSANRFLRGMVRAMVGTLLEMGQERLTSEDLMNILKSGDRSSAGRAVPAEGLYLTEVLYPDSIFEQE
jgi:tRNA pseudouridine38-40 synthase